MKIYIFVLVSLMSAAYGQEPNDYYKSVDNIALSEANAYARLSSKNSTSASNNFDIKYYRCEWNVDPAIRYISGKVTSYFIITTATDNISFDLVDDLIVDSIKQRNNLLSFDHANNTLNINFESIKDAGSLDSLTIFYQGILKNPVPGNFYKNQYLYK